jgi:hypothetical protein
MLMKSSILTLVLAFVFCSAGCSSKNSKTDEQASKESLVLRDVDSILRNFSGASGKAPTKALDLAAFESNYQEGYRAVKSGEIVVVWGVKMAGEGEAANAPANVIAYEKKAPTEGGYVLLQNGTIKKMSKEEFDSTPKAKN